MTEPTSNPAQRSPDDFALPSAVGLRKNAAPRLEMVRVAQLKPCETETVPGKTAEEEPKIVRQAVYVTLDGQQVVKPCTQQLFAAIEDGRLDMRDDCDFLFFTDPSRDLAVRVEPVKKQEYLRGLTPSELEGVKFVEFSVDREGGFATLVRVPAKTSLELAVRLKRALDQVTSMTVGDKLLGQYPITEVRSDTGMTLVSVNPNPTPKA